MPDSRPFPDQLTWAAHNLDILTPREIQTLLWRAAIQLRAAEASGLSNLEHIPVFAYHLLRQLGRGPLSIASLHGVQNVEARQFLLTRGLAQATGDELGITPAGRAIGEVEDDRG